MAKTNLTAARLRELLEYNPETGQFTWRTDCGNKVKPGDIAGSVSQQLYTVVGIDKYVYPAHRLAWLHVHGAWPSAQIDHINGDRGDNRIANLRAVPSRTNTENQRNARKNNTHGFLGAHRVGQRWQARIMTGGRHISLGVFATGEEAHAAYLDAKRRLHEGCTI